MLPPGQDVDHADQRHCRRQECDPFADIVGLRAGNDDDDQAADGRAEDAGDVHIDAIERQGRFELARFHQFRQHRQQRRIHHGVARPDGEEKSEQ